jgi:hypothetical protein
VCSTVSRTAVALSTLLLTGGVASANPASVVPSPGLTPAQALLDYTYELDTATIARENVGDPAADPNGGIPIGRELEFTQFRHVLTPRVEVGLVTDTWLSAALPITINQARELTLADGITRDRLTTLRDGLLPMDGFDASDPGTPPGGDMLFKGVSRSGLDQLHLGASVAPMNQRRDDTKPTWKMGVELRLSVGGIMAFSANNPKGNNAVGRGVHELRLWTTVDRQFSWVEGWFGLYYQVPLTTRKGSLFTEDLGFGIQNARPPQEGGVHFGLETFLMDDVLDEDPTDPGPNALSHPGISNSENYLKTGATFGVRAILGPHVRFGATVDINWKTDHVITFADAGVDLDTCSAGEVGNCETEDNDVVDPGTREVNPLHAPLVDQVGHRYISQNAFSLVVGVNGQFLF